MNVYIQFPDKFDESKSILTSFIQLCKASKDNKKINLFYSKNEVKDFIGNNEDSETYLIDEVKTFRQFMMSARTYDVFDKLNDSTISYIQWNFDNFSCLPCNSTLSALAERLYENSNYLYAFVNFEEAIKKCRTEILVFKDAKHISVLPNHFLNISDVTNFSEFDYWYQTNHITEFSLRHTDRFRKRSDLIMKGAVVYHEFDEDRYWHKDTFHHYIEYEVYDGNGDHLATANELGKIDFTKKDNTKKNVLNK
jgi:hypothetical protein